MRSKKEIIIRAILLLCVSDRACLEMENIGGIKYSVEQRDAQRNKIYNWLINRDYYQYMTPRESAAFEESIGGFDLDDICIFRFQYEALGILLWALNLYDLPEYTNFLYDDFHPLLNIGANHSFEELERKCRLRSEEEIALQTEAAMLWHWRAIEMGNVPKDGRSWGDCIKLIFGEEYEEVLKQIPQSAQAPHDFLVGEKPVSQLNKTEQGMLDIIAYWRHYAFEWIMGDDAWDEVSVDT